MFIEHPYDCILMDYEMPILKGPDAVLEIRQLERCKSVCIIGVSGNVLPEDVQYFLSCGADCVLAKPVKFQELEEIWTAHYSDGQCNPC